MPLNNKQANKQTKLDQTLYSITRVRFKPSEAHGLIFMNL